MFHEISVEIIHGEVEKMVEINPAWLPVGGLKKNLPFGGVFSTTGQRRLKKTNHSQLFQPGARGTHPCCEGSHP